MIRLSPVQQDAFDRLNDLLPHGSVFVMLGGQGVGKTTVLNQLVEETHAARLNMKQMVDAMRRQHPLALEETFEELVMQALQQNQVVVFDDLDLLNDVMCSYRPYPRAGLLNAPRFFALRRI